MKTTALCLLSLLVSLNLFGFRKANYLDGDGVIQEMKKRHSANSEVAVITMTTIDETGENKVRELLSVVKQAPNGEIHYLLRFLAPQDIAGVTLLTTERTGKKSEQYLYLPAIGEPRKITGTQRSGYFMGSDFTFQDLRKEMPEEYTYRRKEDMRIEGKDTYVIEAAPASANFRLSTGYSKRILYIEKEKYHLLKVEFYDEESSQPQKTFRAYSYNSPEIDGNSHRPRKGVMNNHTSQTISIMTVLKSRLDVPIEEDYFSLERLRAWKPGYDEQTLTCFSH